MTDNIEQMYKLAGVAKKRQGYCDYGYGLGCPNEDNDEPCNNCGYYKESEPESPPFTAEKQLEVIKFFCTISDFHCYNDTLSALNHDGDCIENYNKDFPQALAGLVCQLWQDLTDDERKEIREILE